MKFESAMTIPIDQTFDATYGLVVDSMSEEKVTAHVPVHNGVKQPFGLVHGGVYAAMAEAMASFATAGAVYDAGKFAVGLSNSTNFLRPISSGIIHAVAVRRHQGKTTWIWDVDFSDDDKRLCATARVTIAVRDRSTLKSSQPSP